jgi:hypothetical protein
MISVAPGLETEQGFPGRIVITISLDTLLRDIYVKFYFVYQNPTQEDLFLKKEVKG